MDTEFIPKSRLYRESYLPGGTIRLRNGAYAAVRGAKSDALGLAQVDARQLTDIIQRYVREWGDMQNSEVDPLLLDALSTRSLHIQSPAGIYVSPFPLLMKCTSCSAIDFYFGGVSEDDLIARLRRRIRTISGGPRISCKIAGCSGFMRQLPYLSVHRCGSVSSINIPHPVYRATNVAFLDRSGSFFGSAFQNMDTGERIATALSIDCPACRTRYPGFDELAQRGTPITNGEAFYQHAVNYISLDPDTGKLLSEVSSHFDTPGPLTGLASDLAEGIVFSLIGGLPTDQLKSQIVTLIDDGGTDQTSVADIEKQIMQNQQVLDTYKKTIKPGDNLAGTIIQSLQSTIADLNERLSAAKGVFKSIRMYIPDDITIKELASERRTQETVFFRGAFSELSIFERLADEPDSTTRTEMQNQWGTVQSHYAVRDITHISDLNVVLATIGYTRERRMPSQDLVDVAPVVLNAFQDDVDDSLRGSALAYAMSAATEGLHIRLDPCKVLVWCHREFAWPVPDAAMFSDPVAAHAHLLQTCPALKIAPSEVSREARGMPLSLSAPFHLLHTISHCLLSVAKRHTGYDEKSLSEYLLPMDLSFLIYVGSVQNYCAGGLLTLFKHYLLPWFDDASNFALQCVFDPVCTDQGASCSGCVQTVLGCETFNRGLSRAYLFGGQAIDKNQSIDVVQGFWS